MTEPDSYRIRNMINEAVAAVSGAVVAAGAALATGSSSSAVVAAGVAGFLPQALVSTVGVATGWKAREAAAWWHQVLVSPNDDGVTSEEIAGIIDAHQEEPFVRETILRSVRTLQETLDPCVVTALAMLSREYLREKKAPDRFFRASSRVLADLSRSEYEELARCFRTLLRLRPMQGESYRLRDFRNASTGALQMQLTGDDGNLWEDSPNVLALLRLLRRSDLALEIGVWGGSAAGEVIQIDATIACRFGRLLTS